MAASTTCPDTWLMVMNRSPLRASASSAVSRSSQPVHHPRDPILEMENIEIDQQADLPA
jgi:hypothetical protein